MPEYRVTERGLVELGLQVTRPHAGTPVGREAWNAAIRNHPKPRLDATSVDAPTPASILCHLVDIAALDKGYAYWAAHLYAALQPDSMSDMPQRLTEFMNKQKQDA